MLNNPALMLQTIQQLQYENKQLREELETYNGEYKQVNSVNAYIKSLLRMGLKEFLGNDAACSKNFFVTDIDMVCCTSKECFQFYEIKKCKSEIPLWQWFTYKMFDDALKALSRLQGKANDSGGVWSFVVGGKDYHYYGFHELIFETLNPKDGKIYLNDREITCDELVSHFSFKDVCEFCYSDCTMAEPCPN